MITRFDQKNHRDKYFALFSQLGVEGHPEVTWGEMVMVGRRDYWESNIQ